MQDRHFAPVSSTMNSLDSIIFNSESFVLSATASLGASDVALRIAAMIRVKLTSILVNDQNRARAFYTEKVGFKIKHDIPMGTANWLTLTAPDDPGGVELLLEPNSGVPEAAALTAALYARSVPQSQLYTADIAAEYEALKAKGVVFKAPPAVMGPTTFADFDDTCGNWIRLLQG
jgi:catechol 2,3-dioxygenase-like lactoylglutathione lyase family enzyme